MYKSVPLLITGMTRAHLKSSDFFDLLNYSILPLGQTDHTYILFCDSHEFYHSNCGNSLTRKSSLALAKLVLNVSISLAVDSPCPIRNHPLSIFGVSEWRWTTISAQQCILDLPVFLSPTCKFHQSRYCRDVSVVGD